MEDRGGGKQSHEQSASGEPPGGNIPKLRKRENVSDFEQKQTENTHYIKMN